MQRVADCLRQTYEIIIGAQSPVQKPRAFAAAAAAIWGHRPARQHLDAVGASVL
jgi:hypothetical protein